MSFSKKHPVPALIEAHRSDLERYFSRELGRDFGPADVQDLIQELNKRLLMDGSRSASS